jgi:predicted GTPase
VILAANKAEGGRATPARLEAYALGLGEPLRLSAEHGEGMDDLYRILRPLIEFAEREAAESAPEVRSTCPRPTPRKRGRARACPTAGEAAADRRDRPAERRASRR